MHAGTSIFIFYMSISYFLKLYFGRFPQFHFPFGSFLFGCAQYTVCFPGDTVVKDLPANAGDARDAGSILGSGRCSGEGNGNLLQYSCLENFIDRGAWQATVRGMAKSWTWLSNWTYTHTHTICYVVYLLNVSISMITVFFSRFPLLHDSCFYFMNHNTDFISLKFLNTYLKVLLSTSLTFIGRSLVNFFSNYWSLLTLPIQIQ